ncbi:hypothetical protein BJY52DRAFT_1291920 [Lactarius psammicola]|nr:hypothetical protein BJY52DRAFT_1291920 [Lactarius psammicola]
MQVFAHSALEQLLLLHEHVAIFTVVVIAHKRGKERAHIWGRHERNTVQRWTPPSYLVLFSLIKHPTLHLSREEFAQRRGTDNRREDPKAVGRVQIRRQVVNEDLRQVGPYTVERGRRRDGASESRGDDNVWRLFLSGSRGANWRVCAMSLARELFPLSWPHVYVDIAVLQVIERSEVRNVRVGQDVREDAHKSGGVARVEDEGGLGIAGNEEIGAY